MSGFLQHTHQYTTSHVLTWAIIQWRSGWTTSCYPTFLLYMQMMNLFTHFERDNFETAQSSDNHIYQCRKCWSTCIALIFPMMLRPSLNTWHSLLASSNALEYWFFNLERYQVDIRVSLVILEWVLPISSRLPKPASLYKQPFFIISLHLIFYHLFRLI